MRSTANLDQTSAGGQQDVLPACVRMMTIVRPSSLALGIYLIRRDGALKGAAAGLQRSVDGYNWHCISTLVRHTLFLATSVLRDLTRWRANSVARGKKQGLPHGGVA